MTAKAGAGVSVAELSTLPEDDLRRRVLAHPVPRHVAIIMDGNRRWARLHDRAEIEGHAAGVEAIRILLRHAVRRGVPVMTLYAFSRENWARSDDEVRGLFALLEHAIRSETAELKSQGVRIRLLGRLDEPRKGLVVARETGLGLRCLEVGTSGGLNLRWDHFRYESATGSWGDAASPVVKENRLGSRGS